MVRLNFKVFSKFSIYETDNVVISQLEHALTIVIENLEFFYSFVADLPQF